MEPSSEQFRVIERELQEMRNKLLKYAAELKEILPKLSILLTEIARSIHDPLGDVGEIAAAMEFAHKL